MNYKFQSSDQFKDKFNFRIGSVQFSKFESADSFATNSVCLYVTKNLEQMNLD